MGVPHSSACGSCGRLRLDRRVLGGWQLGIWNLEVGIRTSVRRFRTNSHAADLPYVPTRVRIPNSKFLILNCSCCERSVCRYHLSAGVSTRSVGHIEVL